MPDGDASSTTHHADPGPRADPRPGPTPTEIIMVDERNVACDGGDDILGHPRVWLAIPGTEVMCPYCSRLYVLKPGAGHDSGH
jgi:uncharacterized Zn-finger protein